MLPVLVFSQLTNLAASNQLMEVAGLFAPRWLCVMFSGLPPAAGGLAYFTVPAHTEEGHGLMLWHLGLGLAMLALFTWVSIARWRGRETTATKQ